MPTFVTRILIMLLLLFSYGLYSHVHAASDDALHARWSYHGATGPKSWGVLSKSFSACKSGKHQSPIDIAKVIPFNNFKELTFHYRPAKLHWRLNDHNLHIKISNIDQKEYIIFANKKYYLINIHFHVPSEHQINHHTYKMEAHLVHQDDNGNKLVIATLMDEGSEEDYLQQLFARPLPPRDDKLHTENDVKLDPNEIIPLRHNYYHYVGSLTTPPCSEKVKWVIFQQPLQASKQQIAFFTSQIIANNARPIQRAKNRRVISVKRAHS